MWEAAAPIHMDLQELPQDCDIPDTGAQAPEDEPTRCCCKPSSFHGQTAPKPAAAAGSGIGAGWNKSGSRGQCPFTAPHSIDQAPLAMRAALAICPGWLQAAIWPRAQQNEGPEG